MEIPSYIWVPSLCAILYQLFSLIPKTVIQGWTDAIVSQANEWGLQRPAFCLPGMVPRKAWLAALVVVSVVSIAGLIGFEVTFTRNLRTRDMEATLAVMRTRLKFLEFQYQGRQQDIAGIQDLTDGCKPRSLPEKNVRNVTYTPELKKLLKKISGSKASDGLLSAEKPEDIQTLISLRLMPHLIEDPNSVRPAYHLKSNKEYVNYVIGIPHVQRDKENYLYSTMRSLLGKMNSTEKNDTLIIVMIAETNQTYVVETASLIEKAFPDAMRDNLLTIISPPASYYPNLDDLPLSLGDTQKRVKWRVKQNLDAIFLMSFAHSRGLYYLVMEDDVTAENNYMTKIREFTTSTTLSNPDWFMIQFSTTGGIGKLFRSTDLVYFVTYIQLFYLYMPIDWLIEAYLTDRTCGLEMTSTECQKYKNHIRPTYPKRLFEHNGLFSSLKGKFQKSRNSYLGPSPEFYPHDNPPIRVIMSPLDQDQEHKLMNAYRGVNFFWGKTPLKGECLDFWFEKPSKFSRYFVRSGSVDHTKDRIYKAVFEILPYSEKDMKDRIFITIDEFDEFGMVEGKVDFKYGDIEAMRIRFLEDARYWVIITELEFIVAHEEPTLPPLRNETMSTSIPDTVTEN